MDLQARTAQVFDRFRPKGFILCEHMFSPDPTSPPVRRALSALRLARSFLLLEDDYQVDWEVDGNDAAVEPHPHRVPLRGRRIARRAGQPAAAPQVCLCPIGAAPIATPGITAGSERPPRQSARGSSCDVMHQANR
jgi:hypothetical protein